MMNPLVSIIIPCYNAGLFIRETIDSVLNQSYSNIEIIIIDDGSKDNLKNIIENYSEKRIFYYYQKNSGVSVARNNGFSKSKGKYVVFFDADDIMSDGFLNSRIEFMERKPINDFVCGKVNKFDSEGIIQKSYTGTTSNGVKEILLYKQEVVTCPSNYMFKADFLRMFNINFNSELSSTADRFYLIECHIKGNGGFNDGVSPLFYRVNSNSMSHRLSVNLVNDNAMFYHILLRNSVIPSEIYRSSLMKGYYIIAAAYFKLNHYLKAFKYAVKAFSCFIYCFK